MRTLESFSDETWDRFFEWLADDERELTIEEVRQDLKDAGIDMEPVYKRVREALEKRRKEQA
jgi:hypothetical protein